MLGDSYCRRLLLQRNWLKVVAEGGQSAAWLMVERGGVPPHACRRNPRRSPSGQSLRGAGSGSVGARGGRGGGARRRGLRNVAVLGDQGYQTGGCDMWQRLPFSIWCVVCLPFETCSSACCFVLMHPVARGSTRSPRGLGLHRGTPHYVRRRHTPAVASRACRCGC